MNCRDIVDHIRLNPMLDGYLSVEHGFMGAKSPESALSGKYALWNEYVTHIPELYFSNKTQSVLSAIPLISTDELSDADLPRASTQLSLLAHAYWRHGVDRAFKVRISSVDSSLPDCIAVPWQEVNQRLGRGDTPYQGFYDLFINNYKVRGSQPGEPVQLADLKVENMDLLVPAFNNEAERVFFMSFVEMHAVASPLVGKICEIERKIEEDDENLADSLIADFKVIEDILRACLKTLNKINPIPGSKTFCDPILWSKTIAIFSVAPTGATQGGTSGAFSPMTLLLDALLNRRNFSSEYGKYIINEKAKLLPKPILDFVYATSEIRLADFIIQQEKTHPERYEKLKEAYNQLIEVYAGPEGLLGRHTSKVFNYLGVSTMVGRNQSTSGDERFVHQHTWVDVCAELKIARLERKDQPLVVVEGRSRFPAPDTAGRQLPMIDRTELALHHTREDCWVVINDYVYDITDFLNKHPGGDTIMIAYAGRDVSEHFNTIVAHQKPATAKLMDRMLIGKYECTKSIEDMYVPWMEFVDRLLFIRSITAAQFHHVVDKKLEILFAGHTHTHFIHEHIVAIVNALPHRESIGSLEGDAWEMLCRTEFITTQDLRGKFSDSQLVHFSYVALLFEKESLSLMDNLIEYILERIDSHDVMDEGISQTCLSIILRWLKSHQKTINVIARQEVSLFGHSLMDYVPEREKPSTVYNNAVNKYA